MSDILQQKLAKRGVPLKGLTHGVIESALGGTAKQKITLQQGIPMEKAKGNRKADQDLEKQGAGVDSGRPHTGER